MIELPVRIAGRDFLGNKVDGITEIVCGFTALCVRDDIAGRGPALRVEFVLLGPCADSLSYLKAQGGQQLIKLSHTAREFRMNFSQPCF